MNKSNSESESTVSKASTRPARRKGMTKSQIREERRQKSNSRKRRRRTLLMSGVIVIAIFFIASLVVSKDLNIGSNQFCNLLFKLPAYTLMG